MEMDLKKPQQISARMLIIIDEVVFPRKAEEEMGINWKL